MGGAVGLTATGGASVGVGVNVETGVGAAVGPAATVGTSVGVWLDVETGAGVSVAGAVAVDGVTVSGGSLLHAARSAGTNKHSKPTQADLRTILPKLTGAEEANAKGITLCIFKWGSDKPAGPRRQPGPKRESSIFG